MNKVFISDVWELTSPIHENYEFVNVAVNQDNLLFIDPCLIESWNCEWANKAKKTVDSFFTELYRAYRNSDDSLIYSLLSHAGEQNCTRLGYGRGDNGKGNTPEGLMKDFKPLETLIHEIDTIGIPQDLPVFIPGFAEDGFSDLLTNILHAELNDFTTQQMEKHNIEPNSTTIYYSWDMNSCNWVKKEKKCYSIGKDEILLVPKRIVRKNYLFGVGQYFQKIILERKREEENWYDENGKPISKKDIEKQIKQDDEHWKYKFVTEYTQKYTDALLTYHKNLPLYYFEHGQPLEDDVLDEIILEIKIGG
ncbi:MAG: hypothetical protein R3Y24_14875 [Eubacteriales bacterium]